MKAALFDEVLILSNNIVNAAESAQPEQENKAYLELKALCKNNENSSADHPIQWEALGDFSDSHADALSAYHRGLESAEKLGLVEFKASILFAIAECHLEQGSVDDAAQFALLAQHEAKGIDNNELKSAINGFLE